MNRRVHDWAYSISLVLVMFAIVFLVTGCATQPTEVVSTQHTVTNTVSVRVPVPCIDPADLPQRPPLTTIAPNATTDQIAAAEAADAEALQDYARQLEALLAQCAKSTPKGDVKP